MKEVTATLEEVRSSLEQSVPLLHKLNQLLPEDQRLEPFQLHPSLPPSPEEEGEGPEGGGDRDQEEEEDIVSSESS